MGKVWRQRQFGAVIQEAEMHREQGWTLHPKA